MGLKRAFRQLMGGLLFIPSVNHSTPVMVNSIVADNRADEGGGMYVNHATPQVLHTTIAANAGGDGSGIYVTYDPLGSLLRRPLAMTNTILVSHTVGISVTGGNTVTINGILWDVSTFIAVSRSSAAVVKVQNEWVGLPAFNGSGQGVPG